MKAFGGGSRAGRQLEMNPGPVCVRLWQAGGGSASDRVSQPQMLHLAFLGIPSYSWVTWVSVLGSTWEVLSVNEIQSLGTRDQILVSGQTKRCWPHLWSGTKCGASVWSRECCSHTLRGAQRQRAEWECCVQCVRKKKHEAGEHNFGAVFQCWPCYRAGRLLVTLGR